MVVEIEERPIEVAIDETTRRFLFERIDREWVPYTPRIVVTGEDVMPGQDEAAIPVDVILNAEDFIAQATPFQRIGQDGQLHEVPLGFDEEWGIVEGQDFDSFWSSGVILGSSENFDSDVDWTENPVSVYIGIPTQSGDILIISSLYDRTGLNITPGTHVYEGGVIPQTISQIAEASPYVTTNTEVGNFFSSPSSVGFVIHFKMSFRYHTLQSYQDLWGSEWEEVVNALVNGRAQSSDGISDWGLGIISADEDFWDTLRDVNLGK